MSTADLFNQVLAELTNILTTTIGTTVGSLQQGLIESLSSINLASLLGKRDLQGIISQIQGLTSQLNVNLLGSIPNIIGTLESLYGQFAGQVQTFLTSLNKPQARETFIAASQQLKGDIADAFNSLLNEALGHLTSIATSLASVGLASITTALQGKRGILDTFTDLFNGLTSTLSGHIDNITTSVVQVGSNLLGAVTPHIQDLQDQLVSTGLSAAQSLLNTLAGISGTLSGKRGLWDDLLAQLSGGLTSITSSLLTTGGQLVDAVTPHLQDLQDQLINHGLDAAQSLLSTLAGISGTLQG